MKRRLAKRILVANADMSSGLSHSFTLFSRACSRFNRLHPDDRDTILVAVDRRYARWAKEYPVEAARLAAERDKLGKGSEVGV